MRRLRHLPSIPHVILLAMLAIAGISAEAFSPDGTAPRLLPLAVAAGLLGLSLGLARTPDSLAHLMAIGIGFGATLVLAAMRMAEDAPGAGFRDRVVSVAAELRDWYVGAGARETTTELLVIVLLQMIVWLGCYLAGWTLARQGWAGVAIALPGSIVFAARVTTNTAPARGLELYIVLALMLLARMTWLRRAGHRPGDGRVDARGWGSLLTATVVAVLVVSLGVSTPEDFSQRTLQPLAQRATDTYLSAQDRTAGWISDHTGLMGSGSPGVDDFPRYTAFDDAFSIGGDLNLTQQPEVLVRTTGPAPYLSAQSYDTYTGRGWESTVEDTFRADGPDGVRYAPELTFRAGQRVPYSSAVRDDRVEVSMEVTPLGPPGDIVFADGEYLTASERASVRMSWRQMQGERLSLRDMDLGTLPPDLTGIAGLLLSAPDLSVEGDAGLLYPSNADARDRLQEVRSQLADRFIDVSWSVAGDGNVDAMFVTGQVPVYDDNVSIERATDRRAGEPYQVTSLASTATEDELRTASTDYPAWATARYLPLPDTVTDRTVELTRNITAGVSTPFDQAKTIEAYLREHITYDIAVGVPDKGVDIVDYVLFENQRGYCEHYASAMTVMLRVLGIPARTVVGYYPAAWDEASGGYLYRQQNAHAWTEAFFPGYGWIRFEPTASQPASAFDGTAPTTTPEQQVNVPTPTEPVARPATPGAFGTPASEQRVPPVGQAVPEATGGSGGGTPWALVGGGIVAAAVVAGLFAWRLLRLPALSPGALFSTMVRWGRAGGVAGGGAVTPREYARRVGRRYPDLAGDATRIVEVYEDERYGARTPEGGRLRQAAEGLRNVRRAVIRRLAKLGR